MTLAVDLTRALSDMEASAEAIRHVALALTSRPDVGLPADFGHRACVAPIRRLARLLGVEEPLTLPAVRSPRRRARTRRARPPKKVRAKPNQAKELEEFVERASPWDPDAYLEVDFTDQQAEAASCRALLLEIIRRASFDWVLYRNSSKLANKQLAESAYHWLFVEDESSKQWAQRERNGKGMLSFLNICETMDIAPEKVRAKVRVLTGRDIMGAGRPAERRKVKHNDESLSSDEHSVFDVDVDSLPTYDPMYSSDERYSL